ncbi:hypothetical protein L1286_17280 [Pseudoalteromonas sp. SMS1]|uniref:hypothetical protein n=1 Tax=Pseudoalteromonas sp. SMS1 TaxID=2908894 RepID=UPI001F1AFB93|nr:hypothetical protein [Pseudoalteromonas sp. SMS1]MCF2859239.1 hypothetical protein [Pseudoalteromonas sp. SMS1]
MDPYFHYYGTYLAALTMGVKAEAAQELAYYTHQAACQTATTVPCPLYFEDYRLSPVLTADTHSEFGQHCCNLAFQSLPAFSNTEVADAQLCSEHAGNTVGKQCAGLKSFTQIQQPNGVCQGDTVTRCYYNPLTDIDWQHGGDFKRHFSERLQQKAYRTATVPNHKNGPLFAQTVHRLDEQSNLLTASMKAEQSELAMKLACTADSAFARKMLNDVIYKCHYDNQIQGISWPLFGCRLYVYQNTWQHEKDTVQAQVTAFIATCYAIQSWLKRVPLKHCGFWVQGMVPSAVISATTQIESLLYSDQDHTHGHGQSDDWARLIAHHLPQGCSPTLYGIALRPTHLYEHALIAGKVTHTEIITDLTGFKRSAWFKFNKAAQYHCDWLARQFCHYELSAFNTRQTLGNLDMWR